MLPTLRSPLRPQGEDDEPERGYEYIRGNEATFTKPTEKPTCFSELDRLKVFGKPRSPSKQFDHAGFAQVTAGFVANLLLQTILDTGFLDLSMGSRVPVPEEDRLKYGLYKNVVRQFVLWLKEISWAREVAPGQFVLVLNHFPLGQSALFSLTCVSGPSKVILFETVHL